MLLVSILLTRCSCSGDLNIQATAMAVGLGFWNSFDLVIKPTLYFRVGFFDKPKEHKVEYFIIGVLIWVFSGLFIKRFYKKNI
jgi:hypothetical protein